MELAKLQKGRWPSIPKLNLGLVKTTAGAAHANGNGNRMMDYVTAADRVP